MKRLKENKGITLIALIITIIVMLILVGVTVTTALNGGLFNKAKIAAGSMQEETENEVLLSAVIGAMKNDATVDFSKLDNNLPKGFTGRDGIYESEMGNIFVVYSDGTIEKSELGVKKIVTEDDEEYAYWKTDGEGTIVYWDYPDDKEVPKTLIIPCQVGDEIIKYVDEVALWGVKVQRDGNGLIELDENEQVIYLDTELDKNGNIIQTEKVADVENIIVSEGIELCYLMELHKLKSITIPASLDDVCLDTDHFMLNIETVKFNEGRTEIPSGLCSYMKSLKTVILPSTLTEIGVGAFEGCTSLKNINIVAGITTIETNTFKDCMSLTNINIPNSITKIGDYAFSNCTSIKSIYVPDSVDNLGSCVFEKWTNEQIINMQKIEQPPLDGTKDSDYPYNPNGWLYNWKDSSCHAQVYWGK